MQFPSLFYSENIAYMLLVLGSPGAVKGELETHLPGQWTGRTATFLFLCDAHTLTQGAEGTLFSPLFCALPIRGTDVTYALFPPFQNDQLPFIGGQFDRFHHQLKIIGGHKSSSICLIEICT